MTTTTTTMPTTTMTTTTTISDAAAPSDAVTPSLAGTIDDLLRDRTAIYRRIAADHDLLGLARAMILTIIAGAAVFGGAVGAHRGGLQILFAAAKFPLVLLLTAAVCAPTLSAANAALGRASSARRDLALVVSSLAVTALILAAAAPLMILGAPIGLSGDSGEPLIQYHDMALLMAGACAVAGAAGLATFWRGLGRVERGNRLAVAALVLAAFTLVGAQMAWTLRPYLVRPRSPDIVFVRSLEGSLFDAVLRTADSSRGRYERPEAPLPGEPE
jgi:hypothetical protein